MCSLTAQEFLGSKKLVCFILPSLGAWDGIERMKYPFNLKTSGTIVTVDGETTAGHLIFITLIFVVKSKWSQSHSIVSDSFRLHGPYSPRNFPGQNSGVGSHSLVQGIFPIQGLNPGLPHCKQILYQPSQKGSPRLLEWVAYPFSRGSSWLRNWTGVSCIANSLPTELPGKPMFVALCTST